MSVFLLFRSKKNMKISYLQFAVYLLPRIDELAHFILCPFLQKYSKRRTLPSIFFTLLSPSKKNGEPHGQPRAVSCRRTTKLSCPQTKKLSCGSTGDKSCLWEGASSQSIEFSLASAETECCFGFRSADLCGFPSNSSSNRIRKSAFLWSGQRLSAMLQSLTNLSWVSFFNSFHKNQTENSGWIGACVAFLSCVHYTAVAAWFSISLRKVRRDPTCFCWVCLPSKPSKLFELCAIYVANPVTSLFSY